MKDKRETIKKAAVTVGITAAIGTVGGIIAFNAHDESMVCYYGPAPVDTQQEVTNTETEDNKYREILQELDPDEEKVVCDYGVVIPERKGFN